MPPARKPRKRTCNTFPAGCSTHSDCGPSWAGLAADGQAHIYDGWAYPAFRLMRAAVKDQAELIAVSGIDRADLTYASGQETEKAHVQYVSGWMFDSFGNVL